MTACKFVNRQHKKTIDVMTKTLSKNLHIQYADKMCLISECLGVPN